MPEDEVVFDRWAMLLGIEPSDLPQHCDWIPTLRALTAIVRWLQRPDWTDFEEQVRNLVAHAFARP